jgi:hypothetical protein
MEAGEVRYLYDTARAPVDPAERARVFDATRHVTVLALMDALDHPERSEATDEAVRTMLDDASVDHVTVLLEPFHAKTAHNIIDALNRAGLVDPHDAQVMHMRIDMRPTPRTGAP